MKTFGLVMMILFILISLAGLVSMLYGFATAKSGAVAKNGEKNHELIVTDRSTKVSVSKEYSFQYNYSTSWDIGEFIQALRDKNPKAQKDAFIVFGIISFVSGIFLALGFGMLAYKNYFGLIFIGIVLFTLGVVVKEFVKAKS